MSHRSRTAPIVDVHLPGDAPASSTVTIDTVRLSDTAKGQLLKLKRITGIRNWNTLCRWALCVALADESPPLVREVICDSNVEMTWKTFAGAYGDIYLALLKRRCLVDGGDPFDADAVAHTLTIHLHRGIGFLAGRTDLRSIQDLVFLAAGQPTQLDFFEAGDAP